MGEAWGNSSGAEDGGDVVHSALMEKGARGTLAEAASDDSDDARLINKGVFSVNLRGTSQQCDTIELMVSAESVQRGKGNIRTRVHQTGIGVK